MRYTEFNLTEDELFELNMSPGNLKKMAQGIDARAGMEFELIVPGVEGDDGDQEPDYDQDERCRSIQDARDFFYDGDYNGRQDIERMSDRMQNDYAEWLYERIDRDFVNESEYLISEWVANNVDESEWNPNELEGEARQEALDEFIANVDADPSSDYYQQALDEYREENQDSYDESDWLDAEDLDLMSGVENVYNITWPHWRSTGGGEASIDDIADDFGRAIGRPVNAASSYHGGRREAGHYVVEPDGSLQGDDGEKGLEFVSPVLTVPEMLEDIDKVAKWAGRAGAYTNDSTGLHINVSVPDQKNLDYVKLAMFLGDEYILKQFGREGNTYCKSALQKIRIQAGSNPDRVTEMMRQFQNGLNQLASKMIHTGSTEKFTSINNREGWIEFRSPGGDWLGEYATGENKVTNTLLRAVVALDVATKPEAFKQEYYKKLYKTLNPKGDDDSIQYFARYAAGELPASALKSFIKQIQTKRKAEKDLPDTTTGNTTDSHPEGRGRPHDPNGRYAIVSREDPAAYQTGRGTEPEYQFRFNMSDPEGQHNGRYILAAWAARNNVDPANYMVVDAERWNTPAGAVSGSTQDLQRQRLAAQMPALNTANGNWEIYSIASNNTVYRFAADTEEEAVRAFNIWQDTIRAPSLSREGFNLRTTTEAAPRIQPQSARGTESLPPGNARWLILDRNDQEVYSFINTTAQSDANQYARNWMINTAPAEVRDRGPFNIVPAR
jgi:hypothetical protein